MGERKRVVSTCLGCIGNCGAIYEVEENRIVKVKGDPDSPLTRGYICPKGTAVEDVRSNPERLRHPLRRTGNRGEGKWEEISWEEAIGEVAERLAESKEKYGPESFVLAGGSGGVLAGLNPVTSKFLHLFGSPNRMEDLHI